MLLVIDKLCKLDKPLQIAYNDGYTSILNIK